MSPRTADDVIRTLCKLMNGAIVLFLLTPIVVTTLMAFDSRDYLGPRRPRPCAGSPLASLTAISSTALRRA